MEDKTGIQSVFHENGHFRIEDTRFSNDELGEIVSRLDIPEGADVLMVLNLCSLCRYGHSCPDAGKYGIGQLALPEMAGNVIAVDKENLQVPYAEIRKKLIVK